MEHEPSIGKSDDWYTPKEIFDTMGCRFDLDPCSPGGDHWVPADHVYTKEDDGLSREWHGFVFMNPPFGGRNHQVPWIERFIEHGNGVGVARAYTSAGWFHDHLVKCEYFLFPRGKTKFVRPDGSVGKAPGSGVVFFGIGQQSRACLMKLDGWFVDNRQNLISQKSVSPGESVDPD